MDMVLVLGKLNKVVDSPAIMGKWNGNNSILIIIFR